MSNILRDQRLMWILWPSFLVACALELFVFALLDPEGMEFMGQPLEWSRNTVYSNQRPEVCPKEKCDC